jgi:FOG: Ankyrin repeat
MKHAPIKFPLVFALVAAVAFGFPVHARADDYSADGYTDNGYTDNSSDGGSYDDGSYADDSSGDDPAFDLVRTGSLSEIRAGLTDKKDTDGNSLLMIACQAGRGKDIVSYLVDAGCAVEGKNLYGVTPLMFASGYAADHGRCRVSDRKGRENKRHRRRRKDAAHVRCRQRAS